MKARDPRFSDPLTARHLIGLEQSLLRAAHASGEVLMKYYLKNINVREKPAAGLVTDADLASEAACVKILRRARPDFGFLTEEAPPERSKGSGRWIIDPLDGTTNYVHRFPMFCVSLAAEWQGEIVAGVIHHPVLQETYFAAKRKGAFLLQGRRKTRLRISKTRKLTDSLLTTGFTYRKDEWLHEEMSAFEDLSKEARAIRRPGSAALDLAYVARGVFDGFWERRLSPWDVAAGSLLVQEAGGKVTDFKGNRFRIHFPELLASNSLLHTQLLKKVAITLR